MAQVSGTKQMHIIMPAGAYDALNQLSKKQRRSISDVVREAVEVYLHSQGLEVQVAVEHGGDRRTEQATNKGGKD